LNIIKKTALYFARKKYCKAAIETRADLSAIREKPTPKMIIWENRCWVSLAGS